MFFQEQERKRQELAYLKQLEMKKRHDEKLLLLEQRKAEKDAQREKKIVRSSLALAHIHQVTSFVDLSSKRNTLKSCLPKNQNESPKTCNYETWK